MISADLIYDLFFHLIMVRTNESHATNATLSREVIDLESMLPGTSERRIEAMYKALSKSMGMGVYNFENADNIRFGYATNDSGRLIWAAAAVGKQNQDHKFIEVYASIAHRPEWQKPILDGIASQKDYSGFVPSAYLLNHGLNAIKNPSLFRGLDNSRASIEAIVYLQELVRG